MPNWYTTSTGASRTTVACSAAAKLTGCVDTTLSTTDPGSGYLSPNFSLAAAASGTVALLQSGAVGYVTWSAGTWTLKWTDSSGTGDLDVTKVTICRLNDEDTELSTVATWTGTEDLGTTGVHTIQITQSGSDDGGGSGGTGDTFFILIEITNSHSKQARTWTATFDQPIAAPSNATTHALAGAVAAQATVTGNATVSHANWSLAGSIAAAATVTGNATVSHVTWSLGGAVGAQATVTGDLVVTGGFLLRQQSFRWRKDDGSESGATWLAATNVDPATILPDVTYRLRFLLQEYGGTAGGNGNTYALWYRINAGTWYKLSNPAGNGVLWARSELTGGSDTTQQIGAGSFLSNNDAQIENAEWTLPADIPANGEVEVEFGIVLTYVNFTDADVVEFRVEESDGTDLDAYTNTPSPEVDKPAYRRYEMIHYRWRHDDGDEATATWMGPVDTPVSVPLDTTKRLRIAFQEKYNCWQSTNSAGCQGMLGLFRDVNDSQTGWVYPSSTAYVKMVLSQLVQSGDCVQRISSGTFVSNNDGQWESSNNAYLNVTGDPTALTGGEIYEVEVSVQFLSTELVEGDKVELYLNWESNEVQWRSDMDQTVLPTAYAGTIHALAGTVAAQATVTGNADLNEVPADTFASDLEHETDFTTEWTNRTVEGSCTLTVVTSPVYRGSKAAKCTFDGTNDAVYSYTTFGGSPTEIYGRIYIYLSSDFDLGGTWVAGPRIIRIGQTSTTLFEAAIQSTDSGTSFRLAAWARNGAGLSNLSLSGPALTVGVWHQIEFHWIAGSGSDGGAAVWQNGSLVNSNYTWDSDGYGITVVQAGSYYGNPPASGNYIVFDDVALDTGGRLYDHPARWDQQISGSVAAQATVTGNATVSHANWSLAGSVAAQATVTGDASVSHANWALAAGGQELAHLTAPATDTNFTAHANGSYSMTFTPEITADNAVLLFFRYSDWDSMVRVELGTSSNKASVSWYDGQWHLIDETVGGVFTDGVEATVDVTFLGGSITVEVDSVEKASGECTYNQSVAQGRIQHDLDTNDIDLYSYAAPGVFAQAAVTGDLTVSSVTEWQLSGSIAAQATVTGDATVSHANWSLAGAVSASSSLTGDATISHANWTLAGTVSAASTVTGDLAVQQADWALAGSVAAQAAVAGDLTVQHATWSLAGSVAAQASVVGDLVIEGTWPLAGAIAAQATVVGDLAVQHTTWSLAGAVAAQAAVTGDLVVTSDQVLAGSVAAQATVTGDLAVQHATWALAGAVAAQAGVTGNLVVDQAQWALAGTIAAQATVTGDLVVGEAEWALAGAIAAQAAVTGDLTLIEAQWALAGAIAAQAAVTGDLVVSGAGWGEIINGVSASNFSAVDGVSKSAIAYILGA